MPYSLFVAVLGVCLGLFTPPVVAQGVDNLRDKRLIADIKADIAQLAEKETELNEAFLTLEQEAARQAEELKRLQAEKQRLERRLQKDVVTYNDTLIYHLKHARAPASALLTYDALTEQPGRETLLTINNKIAKQQLESSRNKLHELFTLRRQIEEKQQRIGNALQKLTQKRRRLSEQKQTFEALLNLTPNQRAELAPNRSDIENIARIQELIEDSLHEESDITTLQYPIRGEVVVAYGQHDPATGIASEGIRVRPSTDDLRVRLPLAGTIIYSGPFKGYGNLVIVKHVRGVHSLYGNLSTQQVQVGDNLDKHDTIGRIAKNGDDLYMEVRLGATTRNPVNWLAALTQ